MIHLYFHVFNRTGATMDDEGLDVADCAAAHNHALIGIRELLSVELMTGQMDLHGHLDVVDDAGRLVERIPFADAVTILPA